MKSFCNFAFVITKTNKTMYKKAILLTSAIALSSVLNVMAQDDDMYFTPKKKTAAEKAREAAAKEEIRRHSIGNTYYVGSDRDVDEYNRRGKYGSYFEKVGTDSIGNDIIEFHVGDGTYPALTDNDTTIIDIVSNDFDNSKKKSKREYVDEDSYIYSRNFSRFDGFYSPYYSSWYYRPGYYHTYFGFYDPWYWDPWYYNAWYDPWFDPWYDPFYYGPHWHGWGPHYYWGYWGGPRYIIAGKPAPIRTHNHSTAYSSSHGSRRGTANISRQVSTQDRVVNRAVQNNQRIYNSRAVNRTAPIYNTQQSTPTYSAPSRSTGSYSGGASSGGGFSGRTGGAGHGARSGGGFGGRR